MNRDNSRNTGKQYQKKTNTKDRYSEKTNTGERYAEKRDAGKQHSGKTDAGKRSYDTSKTDSKNGRKNYAGSGGKITHESGKKNDFREIEGQKKNSDKKSPCRVEKRCGGCCYLGMSNEQQMKKKEQQVKELLKGICPVSPILGMKEPWGYRNKVHAAFAYVKGNVVSGMYEESTHTVVPVERCLIEDEKADAIIGTIRDLLKSFKVRVYDEATGYGLLRHVLVRRGFRTGQILVVLVCTSPIFPSKNNFVKALRKDHPEITSVVLNINDKYTSMVLGERNIPLYGKGYIEDVLCGKTFRISPSSFYQVNPVQTEILYNKAIELAGLTGKERVVDAYCGIGTIGQIAAGGASEVIGVELNREAVSDAKVNARMNGLKNTRYFAADAGNFMVQMAEQGEHVDVLFMDPPRAGSDLPFLESAVRLQPDRIVYISCNPETLARDLKILKKKGYNPETAVPVDLFPWTAHVETVVLLSKGLGESKK